MGQESQDDKCCNHILIKIQTSTTHELLSFFPPSLHRQDIHKWILSLSSFIYPFTTWIQPIWHLSLFAHPFLYTCQPSLPFSNFIQIFLYNTSTKYIVKKQKEKRIILIEMQYLTRRNEHNPPLSSLYLTTFLCPNSPL